MEYADCVVRVEIVGYGDVSYFAHSSSGIVIEGPGTDRPVVPIYRSLKVKVLGQLKGDGVPAELTLEGGGDLAPSIAEEAYPAGAEFLFFLKGASGDYGLVNPYFQYRYEDGMVTGLVYEEKPATVSIAEFRRLLTPEVVR
jgi:hypothetical protein